LLLTTFTVPLLPGLFGSAAAGVESANAQKTRLARIIKRPIALRMSWCSTFLARRPGVLADSEAGSLPRYPLIGNVEPTSC
jgi:hypothetical protein